MSKQIPSYLRLVTDITSEPAVVVDPNRLAIDDVCRAFTACGWQLAWAAGPSDSTSSNLMWSAPVNPGVGTSPGHIRLFSTDEAGRNPRVSLEQAAELAGAIGRLWGEVLLTRRALRCREAELATGVPLVLTADDEKNLGDCLEAVLRAGAEAIGCQAAALYLLDEATSQLKLRSCWNLPERRFTAGPRPLRGALADLEALLGHAVVLRDPGMFDYWKAPEEGFAAAVCVPVSSGSVPLGTLWIFSQQQRDFSDQETNLIEVVAGRVVADLERQVLANEVQASRQAGERTSALSVWEQPKPTGDVPTSSAASARKPARLARPQSPKLEGWDISGRSHHPAVPQLSFHDWFNCDPSTLNVSCGMGLSTSLEGALTAGTLRAAVRACAADKHVASTVLERANWTLWTSSPGSEGGGLFFATLAAKRASISFAASGAVRVIVVRDELWRRIATGNEALGLDESIAVRDSKISLDAGELMLIYAASPPARDKSAFAELDSRLALALQESRHQSADRLAELASQLLTGQTAADHTAVVIKRRQA